MKFKIGDLVSGVRILGDAGFVPFTGRIIGKEGGGMGWKIELLTLGGLPYEKSGTMFDTICRHDWLLEYLK